MSVCASGLVTEIWISDNAGADLGSINAILICYYWTKASEHGKILFNQG